MHKFPFTISMRFGIWDRFIRDFVWDGTAWVYTMNGASQIGRNGVREDPQANSTLQHNTYRSASEPRC